MEAYKIINESLSSDNPVIRVNAIEFLLPRNGKIICLLSKALQDPYVPVRFAAAVAIGEMQYTPAANAINQSLRDRDPNVAIAASYAMIRLDYPEYIQVLRDSIINSNNKTIKANSALL